MASFYAELQVAGAAYRLLHCTYACQQATDGRGRTRTRVRHLPLQLVLDVPTDDVLLDWAATPHKPLAGAVVFYDVVQHTALETIAFTAGECVGYFEQFSVGAAGDGSYTCALTIAAPSFELRTGGPAVAAPSLPVALSTAVAAARAPVAAVAAVAPAPWHADLAARLGPAHDVPGLVARLLASGLSETKLQQAFAQAADPQVVFERLRDAKRGIYQYRVIVDDFDNIPGVTPPSYVSNGLPSTELAASDFGVNDPALNLPAFNATTFTQEAKLVEIKPGEKLYRVTNDPAKEPYAKTGGYWTRTPPAALSEVIGGTAVMPEWNDFQSVYEFTVPPYADPVAGEPKFHAWEGPAAAQPVTLDYPEKSANGYHLPGGASQLFVPNKLSRDPGFGKNIQDVTALHKLW